MLVSEMNGIRPVDAGRQDCHDLHSWGPGVRQCYIIHYIISGKGTFTCGKKTYTLTAGQSFLICPAQVVQYAPDEAHQRGNMRGLILSGNNAGRFWHGRY